MRHKKKRNTPANTVARSPERLDYSDDVPLQSTEYQEAIRAHLNEFQDTTLSQSDRGREQQNTSPSHDHESLSSANGASFPSLDRYRPLPAASKIVARNSAKSENVPSTDGTRNKERIWNTTTNEERERIKDFWLNLGEEERRSLVKVEKEAVLRKMKEQQKKKCSCSVCGRKRTAVEEELEVLYDAYYEELEQYANQQQLSSQTSFGTTRHHHPRLPKHGKITEVLNSDDSEGSYEQEDDFSDDVDILTEDDLTDDEGDEPYSEEDYDNGRAPSEFFKFGNSLTVKGGILTVADDLLKNDGRKFIDMMEQLAERRMQREEEAAMEAREYDEGEEDNDDYDDDDIDSEEYDDDEEDEQDAMTEEQRMIEGRRMFQIFAARMFEQRVLTAYREKVAQERQAQLLQELEMEDSREKEREAKKAKEKEKKKDKKRQQQLKKEEEKARREAEKLAEEAAAKAEEDRKAEEARKRKDEQRLKRESEKKALELEKLRKEEEKRKRLLEEKVREAKRQEQLAKEKKLKEDALRKERESKELAAKEAKAKSSVTKAQKEAEAAKGEASRTSASLNSTPSAPVSITRKVSPPSNIQAKSSSTAPAIPKAQPAKDVYQNQAPARVVQESNHYSVGPSNIPSAKSQQHHPLTPGAISPQPFGPHQNSYSRGALVPPPSMPVPLPPPGIGSHSSNGHDPYGYSSPQSQPGTHMQNGINGRANGQSSSHVQTMQAPPGVFASVPSLVAPTSPQSRIGTPQGTRYNGGAAFNPFNGLNPGTPVRDENGHHDPEILFPRRILLDNVGPVGRPPVARTSSALPAPIQRPSAIVPPRNAPVGTNAVLGSRALLDDDDAIVDAKLSGPVSNSSVPWLPKPAGANMDLGLGSAALNGSIDETFQAQRSPYAFNGALSSFPTPIAGNDRWGSIGGGGVTKSVGHSKSGSAHGEDKFPLPSKPVDWGF